MNDNARISVEALGAATAQHVRHHEKRTCSVCGSTALELAVDMPALPLTGVFLEAVAHPGAYCYDQGLTICAICGHAQLQRCLAPEAVYDQTYFHRSSASNISRSGNDAFAEFVRAVVGERRFRCFLEIGANDLYMINKIRDLAEATVGLDPIWKQLQPPVIEGVSILGKFVEELSVTDLPGKPDLLVSVQTFEHIDEPMEQLSRLVNLAADGALIFLEVPSFDALLRNLRFDQVFHQHIQYFSLASMLRLIEELGCSYVAHSINHRYWGGALGVAFVKGKAPEGKRPQVAPPTPRGVAERYQACRDLFGELMGQIEACPAREIYGFGAAQMVPTLAYHMGSDLGFLGAILDDDPRRDGLFYPGLAVRIRKPPEDFSLAYEAALITAVDSTRPILRRLIEMNPQQLIIPFPSI
jgi:hypothetical protein